jgi:hypothetical protein
MGVAFNRDAERLAIAAPVALKEHLRHQAGKGGGGMMPGDGTVLSRQVSFSFEYSRVLSAGSIAGAPLVNFMGHKKIGHTGPNHNRI